MMWGVLVIIFKYYINYDTTSLSISKKSIFTLKTDLLGFTLLLLSIFTGLFCLFFLDLKLLKIGFGLIIGFVIILATLIGFFCTSNVLTFFTLYELLLAPSIILTYLASPNLRSKHVAFYFLLWTQLGSFLVLLAVSMLIVKYNNFSFNNLRYLTAGSTELAIIKTLLFFGFGIKIPIWPFHFWLTKTHVEVNTSFSIFLSGILVKTALFGLYKFSIFFTTINFVFFLVVFIGIFDAAIKIFTQTDLKKIVAYCTVFEMNIILTNFFFMSYHSYLFLIYFSLLHTLLSFYFFFTVDCIYKRFNTRSIASVNNILNSYPNLAILIVVGVVLFNGIPLTLKFNLEVIFFSKLLTLNAVYFLLFFSVQILGIIFFTKQFFSILFFSSTTRLVSDLTAKELSIFLLLVFVFLLFSFN